MRCFNCNNVIPEASTKCPYCGSNIDPTKTTIKPEVDMGSVDDLNFNDKLDLMKYIKEPKNKKNVMILGGIILFLLIIIVALILSLFSKSGSSVNFYRGIINKVSDYLDDNYLGNNNIGTGTYNFTYAINGKGNEFNGEYGYDIKNKILSLNGSIKDPKVSKGVIVLDALTFNYDIYLKNDSLYGKFSDIFDKYILFPIDDTTGLLATKNYDLSSLVHGILNALEEVTYNISTTSSGSVSIDYRGESTTANKKMLILNNKNKVKLYKIFYEELIEDANFINEYARVSGKKADDIKQSLQNEITNIEYRYSGESDKETSINVYYSGQDLYRIEIDRTKEDENDLLYIDIGETKYYMTYKKDNERVLYATLSVLSKEVQDINNKTIELNIETKNDKLNAVLKLKENLKPNLKKTDTQDYKSIRDFTEDDINTVKGNLSLYLEDTSLVDDLKELFKNKCTPELNCDCPDGSEKCKCVYDQGFIQCSVDDVKQPIV